MERDGPGYTVCCGIRCSNSIIVKSIHWKFWKESVRVENSVVVQCWVPGGASSSMEGDAASVLHLKKGHKNSSASEENLLFQDP